MKRRLWMCALSVAATLAALSPTRPARAQVSATDMCIPGGNLCTFSMRNCCAPTQCRFAFGNPNFGVCNF